MQDYMKKRAAQGTQSNTAAPVQAKTNGIPNSALQDVFSGKAHATSEMMGHSKNLAPSIAAKMSRSFGMDLTGMQVYQSDAMVGSGMQGMAQGNKVVLSSDVDLNTTAGQAVLGHEISHIHAQSQGIVTGHSGLYENAALEHQADTEGLMAAQGKSIYQSGGMDTGMGMQYGLGMQGVEGMTPLGGGMGMSAGAPMQADKDDDDAMPLSSERPSFKLMDPRNPFRDVEERKNLQIIERPEMKKENLSNVSMAGKDEQMKFAAMNLFMTGDGDLADAYQRKYDEMKKSGLSPENIEKLDALIRAAQRGEAIPEG